MAISKREKQRRLIKRLKVMQKFFKKHRGRGYYYEKSLSYIVDILQYEKDTLNQIKDRRKKWTKKRIL